MVVGAVGDRTEIAVIGAGPGGYAAALRAADAGFDVTLVEREALGGVCLNVGCIPSKTLIEIANLRWASNSASDHGLVGGLEVEASAIGGHLAAVSASLRSGVQQLLRSAGVTVVSGTARFMRNDRLVIEHDGAVQHLDFDDVILATGSRPRDLDALRFEDGVLDSTGALALEEVPGQLIVVGAGYIGVELGTAWAKLGAHVSIIETADRVLPAIPEPLSGPVAHRLDELGVDVHTGRTVTSRGARGVVLDDGTEIPGSTIVVAVGRRPNSDGCGLEVSGASVDPDGFVVVDDDLRAAPNVYAIGDLIRGPALAHRATSDAERVVAHLRGTAHPAPSVVPAVIYSDPEVMTVGSWPGDEPDEALRPPAAALHRYPHAASARARTVGASRGATYVVTDEAGTVIGVHAVGPHASELAGEAALAVEMAATLEDLALTVHAHPTMSESIAEAALFGLGRPLHIRP